MTQNRSTRVSGQRRGWKRVLGNVALVGLAVAVSLLLAELLLRALGISYPVYHWTDPVLGVAHIPGTKSGRQFEGQSWVEINRDGMRGPEAALERPAGSFRIALIGDSFIEAFEVPYQKTVGEVIAQRLSAIRGGPVEVLNFGHGGYGTAQELLTLKHKVWKYSPDLVLLAVTAANDISDNSQRLKRIDYVPYYVFQDSNLVLDQSYLESKGYRGRTLWTRRMLGVVQHSRLAQLVNRVRHLRRRSERQQPSAEVAPGDEAGLRNEVGMPPTAPEWQEAWRVTEGLLKAMRDECRKKNTPFAIFTVTRGIQVTPDRATKEAFLKRVGAEDLYYPERRLTEFGKREGVPVLTLAPTMSKQAEEGQVYFHAHGDSLGIGHWNEAGHRAAGELIAPWLAAEFGDRLKAKPQPAVSAR